MGFPPASAIPNSSTHLYPQALQLKLYQAFIFSIPILFSIILFLLFYLFYLKRRSASSFSSASQILPTSLNQPIPPFPYVCQIGLKKEIKDKLPIVLFDEDLKIKETQCCVCLGEFEMKEELLQMPSCKHVFHIECIHHWLHTNTTCPLCRSFVIPITTKFENPEESFDTRQPQIPTLEQHGDSSSNGTEQQTVIHVEESHTSEAWATPLTLSIYVGNERVSSSSSQEHVDFDVERQ